MRVRRLFFMLLLVAIPLQGIAAATRMICADMQGSSPLQIGSHAHHAGASDSGHAATSDEAAPDAVHHAGPGSCAHCAACTVGAAIVDSVLSPGALAPPYTAVIGAQAAAQPRPFDGPERPPRTI